MTEPEEYEHVPWSHLTARDDGRRQLLLTVGLVVLGVVGGFGGARFLAAGSQQPDIPATSEAAFAPAAAEQERAPIAGADTDSVALNPSTTVAEPALYREADLLAVLPEEEMRFAAMQAERFVTDFFTVDGQPGAGEAVRAMLPANAAALTLPHDEQGAATYVEWARVYRIDGSEPGGYVASVAYRTLVESEPGVYSRLPLAAVAVTLARQGDGLAIADLPSPVPVPVGEIAAPWAPPVEVPAAWEEQAQIALAALGLSGTVVSGHPEDEGWRLVVDAARPGAPRFPLVIRLPRS